MVEVGAVHRNPAAASVFPPLNAKDFGSSRFRALPISRRFLGKRNPRKRSRSVVASEWWNL
jgi:hypothetical protein